MAPEAALLRAIGRMRGRWPGLRVSSPWRTAPLSPVPQDDILNAVVTTPVPPDTEPRDVLELGVELEREAGRVRDLRWGPRVLDVDLLLFGRRIVRDPDLTVPHPRLTERRFVLAPLAELAADLVVPGDGRTVARALEDLGDTQRADRLVWSSDPLA